MQKTLQNLTTLPGVIGAILFDADDAKIKAQVFPPAFDHSVSKNVAEMVIENADGLTKATGGVDFFDIRFKSGRILIKHFSGTYLVILCEVSVNIHYLKISLNVAINKLESLIRLQPIANSNLQDVPPDSTLTNPITSHEVKPKISYELPNNNHLFWE